MRPAPDKQLAGQISTMPTPTSLLVTLAALAPALLCDHEQRRLRLEDGGVLDFSKFNDPMSAKFDAAWNRSASEVEELARWEPTAFAFGYSVLSRKDAFANVQDGIFATHAAPLPRVDW